MKKIIVLLIITAQLAAFGQSTPDQQLIPEYVLKGKSASELRLKRNEIFARYGYIFQSSDLSEYFNKTQWYKPTKSNVDHALTEIDKANIELITRFENLSKKESPSPTYTNESNAYFQVVYDPETQGNIQKSRDVTFLYHCNFGTIKKIVERTYFGDEDTPTVVYAETSEPNKPYWETTKYFNDLTFDCSYYRATNYGCCGAENYNELYSYGSNEPFLTFNEKLLVVDIPNSKTEMFIGYNHEESRREGLDIATLYLSTLNGVVNSITFTAVNTEDKEDLIWYFTPKISLKTNNEKNKISNSGDKIELWGSNFAKSTSEINDFSISIEFIADGTRRRAQFDIPIVNGRLKGLSETNSKLVVNLK